MSRLFDRVTIELLHEFISTFTAFENGMGTVNNLMPSYDATQPLELDKSLELLILSCLDSAYAICRIISTKRFDFLNISDPTGLLESVEKTRARKRHPENFIPNTVPSRFSHQSGIKIWYGSQDQEGRWKCRVIFFTGAASSGKLPRLTKGFCTLDELLSKPQILYFCGGCESVNLTLVLHNMRLIRDLLISSLREAARSDSFYHTALSEIESLIKLSHRGTLVYTCKIGVGQSGETA